MKYTKFLLTAVLGSLFLLSCTSDDTQNYNPLGTYDSGVLITNEGNFGTANAEVSFLSFDLNTTGNGIFSANNSGELVGDVAQSIGFNEDLAYIVVNASNKIIISNRYTMKKIAAITTGLNQPRYIAFSNGKGYITNWSSGAGAGFIAVIDLATQAITTTIPVSDFPNKIIAHDGKLFVAHNDIGSNGNSITVINPVTDAVSGSIAVGDMPDNMVVDSEGVLWVNCNGKTFWAQPQNDTAGKILKIDPETNTVTQTFTLGSSTEHISHFAVLGASAYYTVGNKVYKFPLTATTLPTTPAFTSAATFLYGFAVKNNKVYIADAKDFSTKGVIYVYASGEIFDPNPVGTLLTPTPIEVGVGPNGFYFNQ